MPTNLQKVLDPTNPANLDRQSEYNPHTGALLADIGKTVTGLVENNIISGARQGLAEERDAVIRELNSGFANDEEGSLEGGGGGISPIRSSDMGAVSRGRGEEIVDASETAPVKEFAMQMRRLESATSQGKLSPEEAKIRLEAKLRTYLARYPGLTPELQAVGNEVFGMNVLGSELDAALAVRQQRIKSMSDQIKFYLDDAKAIGMNIARPHNDEFWQDYFKTKQVNEDYDRRQKDYQLNQWRYTENKQGQAQNLNEQLPGELQRVVQDANSIVGDLNTKNDKEYSEFIKKNGDRLRQALGAKKEAIVAKYLRSHPLLTSEEVRGSLGPVLGAYDRYINALSGEGKLGDLKTANEIIQQEARGNLNAISGYAQMMEMLSDVGKIGPAGSFIAENFMRQKSDDMVRVMSRAFESIDTTLKGNNPSGVDDKIAADKDPEAYGRTVVKLLDDVTQGLEAAGKYQKGDKAARTVAASVIDFAERASADGLDSLPEAVRSDIEKMMGRPEMRRVLEVMPEEQRAKVEAAFGGSNYVTKRLAHMMDKTVATLMQGFNEREVRLPNGSKVQRGLFDNSQFIARPVHYIEPVSLGPNGELVFKPKSEEAMVASAKADGAIFQFPSDRQALVSGARRSVVNLQRTAGTEWNNLVHMVAHMRGTTNYKQVAEELYPIAQARLNGKGISTEDTAQKQKEPG